VPDSTASYRTARRRAADFMNELDEPLSRSLPGGESQSAGSPPRTGGAIMTIGEMALEFGTTPRALRFYEDKGLLSPRRRGAARHYGAPERERLALVLKAKRLGFTLTEIGEMLAEPAAPTEPRALAMSRHQCFDQIRLLEQRKREIEAALIELRRTYSTFYVRMVAGGG
jgi:DNA-binding transcriptional MerR regulator